MAFVATLHEDVDDTGLQIVGGSSSGPGTLHINTTADLLIGADEDTALFTLNANTAEESFYTFEFGGYDTLWIKTVSGTADVEVLISGR